MTESNPYAPPQSPADEDTSRAGTEIGNSYSPAYNAAMITGLKIQAAIGLLTALMLDGGLAHRQFWVAMLAQWAMAAVVIARRPLTPSPGDLRAVRYGILGILPTTTLLNSAMHGMS